MWPSMTEARHLTLPSGEWCGRALRQPAVTAVCAAVPSLPDYHSPWHWMTQARDTAPLIRSYGLFGSCFRGLTWGFAGLGGRRSDYVKVSGIGAPIRVKASRWALVGSVSMSTVTWAPV